jgi:hypothetical protein
MFAIADEVAKFLWENDGVVGEGYSQIDESSDRELLVKGGAV